MQNRVKHRKIKDFALEKCDHLHISPIKTKSILLFLFSLQYCFFINLDIYFVPTKARFTSYNSCDFKMANKNCGRKDNKIKRV
jgi:hypothetical protein